MQKHSSRKGFTDTLLQLAKEDPSIIAVTTDARGSVTLNQYADELPDQFVELGIAEQNAVTIAAGLSLMGRKAFVSGPACFLAARAFDQVKVDVAYSKTNVKLVGVSGGVSYGPLGGTHLSLHDIAQFRAIPNLTVILPADYNETAALVKQMNAFEGPVYMRVGRGDVYDVYEENCQFEIGKANQLCDGKDMTIIACGEMVYHAKQAALALQKEGISARVLDMHTLAPMDENAVIAAAKETGLILTVEEHDIHGGLGGAVTEIVSQNCPVPVKILGIPHHELDAGESEQLFKLYGIDAQGICQSAREFYHKNKDR